MTTQHLFSFTALICFLFLTSCLTSVDQEEPPSHYAIDLQLEEIGEIQLAGEDTLRIIGVSFLQGRIALQSSSQDSVGLFTGVGVYNYQFPAPGLQRLIAGELEAGTYNRLLYDIEQAEADNQDIPESFIDGEGEDQRYSMIIRGSYNNTEFEYKAARPFSFDFDFASPVEVPANSFNLTMGINFEVNSIFLEADSSGFLDPAAAGNDSLINSNIEDAIRLIPFEE